MGMDPLTVMAGSSLVSGLIGADASSSAADAMAGAAGQSAAVQRGIFDKQVGLQEPFRQFGLGGMTKLSQLLGTAPQAPNENDPLWQKIVSDFQAEHADKYGSPMGMDWNSNPDTQAQYQRLLAKYKAEGGSMGGTQDSSYGSLLKPFGNDDFELDPGTQFRFKYGQQALQNSQAAKNGTLTGAAMKDLLSFNQDYAGTGYQSAFDRYMANKSFTLGSLMGLGTLGQSAASGAASGGSGYASAIGNSMTGAAQAQGAGMVGSANALAGGIGGVGNAYFLSSLLGKNNPAAAVPGAGVVGDFPINQFA